MNGPETTRRLRSELPQMQVVCLSMYDEETAAPIMKKAGAVAYVEKGTSSESLLSAIRDCAHPAAPPPKREGRAAKE
jgi:DNA-binding NarL/FixJ family response regulator